MKSSGAFSSPVIAEIHGRRQLVVQTRDTLHGVDPESGLVLWGHEVPAFRGMNILTPAVSGDAIFTSSYRNGSYLYEVAEGDAGWSVGEKWSEPGAGYMSTPVIAEGHAYLHLGNGRLTCFDLATGARRWTSEPMARQYASLALQGDKILALASDGVLHLVRADPSHFELLGSRRVAEGTTWGHLAISGDAIFVRELEAVSAFRWRSAAAKAR